MAEQLKTVAWAAHFNQKLDGSIVQTTHTRLTADSWKRAGGNAEPLCYLAEANAQIADLRARLEVAEKPMLSDQDMADLRRLDDLFSDGQGWDLPRKRMQRLAELGVVQHKGGGRYNITSFGAHCLNLEWGLPLRTTAQINADQMAAMEARNAAIGATKGTRA